jgi:hypothetical protein
MMKDLKSRLAWPAGLLLFIVIGLALYARQAGDIAVSVYLLVFAIALTIKSRGFLQNVALTVTTILAVFLIATIVITLREPHLVSTVTKLDKPEGSLYARKPIVGWGPGAPGHYRSKHVLNGKLVYDATYTINQDLMRKVDDGANDKGAAFIGDSYVFGEGLEDNETLPQYFADLEGRKAPVYNFGVSAYSPAQALAAMRAGLYDDKLKNSRVIVEFIAPWEADRVVCKATFVAGAPRFFKSDGGVVQQGTCPKYVPSRLRYFAIYRYVQSIMSIVTDGDIDIFTAITQQVIHLAREKYKVPIVIYYLRAPGYLRRLRDWNDDKIINSLRAAGAEVLEYDFPSAPKYSISGDGHPSGLENSLVAHKLIDFLRKKFPDIEPAAVH